MKNWKSLLLTAVFVAGAWSAQNAPAQPPPTQSSSAYNSQSSATPANEPEAEPQKVLKLTERQSLSANRAAKPQENRDLVNACAAAVHELRESRGLIDSLASENRALSERLETEQQTTAILTELNETRKSESEALRAAINAKNETIAAKDSVIAAQDKLVGALKAKKPSTLRRIGDVLIGAAIFAVLK